jgi:EmrB/QacA subfamily drug resistance transporter
VATAERTPEQHVRLIFSALLLVLLLASLDQTIVSTALPTIVGELHGIEHLSWVVTAYLLASTVAGPLYGKLGDLYGRKGLLQVAILIFLGGSVLCGIAQDMPELIVFRAIQGLGGGGLMVTTMAVVGDIIPPRERGRYQGYFGGVFGVSTVVGPLLGGFFVDHLSWRWIFYVNLPIGALALFVIATAFHARADHVRHSVDYVGAALLAAALSSIVLFTSLGGTTYAWGSPAIVTLIVLGIVLTAVFVAAERRAAEPILPLALFANLLVTVPSILLFIVGLPLFGAVAYLPLSLQIVKGHSPTGSGLQMTPMMAGVLVSSIASGQLITRFGRYKPFPVAGTLVMTIALFLLSRLDVGTSTWLASFYMLILGLGLGMVMQVLVLAVQNAVPYEHLGVATSGSTLFRQVGGSIGVSLFGAIFANLLVTNLAERLPKGAHVPSVADPATVKALPPDVHSAFVGAFAASLRPVFLVAAAIGFTSFLFTWLLREVPLRKTVDRDGGRESFAMPRDASSLHEMERIVASLVQHENRWRVYRVLAERAGVELAPDEHWLLARLGGGDDVDLSDAAAAAALERLRAAGLVEDGRLSAQGERCLSQLVEARRDALEELLEGWDPAEHDELRALLDRLARELVAEPPAAPARA